MGWLSSSSEDHLMDSVHWGDKVKNPEKLSDFIKNNTGQCLGNGMFQFLFFENAVDYRDRFGTDMTTSVLGSRPGLYIFKHSSIEEKTGREKTLKIGESERLHERMDSHSSGKPPNIEGQGVVIVRCEGKRCDDQFNIHEMRKLGEVLINDFMKLTTGGRDYDTVRKDGPRAFVSKEGCKQGEELMESLKGVHSRLSSIASVGTKLPTSTEIDVVLKKRGVK